MQKQTICHMNLRVQIHCTMNDSEPHITYICHSVATLVCIHLDI